MKCPNIKELPAPPDGQKGWPWAEESKRDATLAKNDAPWPLISIVTPSYNQDEFIEETIRSVLLQGYPRLEYIIVDGKSTDRSREIIKKYDKWLSCWISEPDGGQSEAINKGWKRSRGEILAWLNSDDIYKANALEKVAQYFVCNSEIDMVYGNCKLVDKYGNFVKSAPTEEFTIKSLVNNKWFIPQQSTFMRRKVYEKIGGLNESLHLVMDWEYWLRVALHQFKIKFYPEVLSNFRIHDDSKTSSQSVRSGQEKIKVLNNIYKDKKFKTFIKHYKDGAYSYLHIWAGQRYYRNNQRWPALVHFLKAITYGPYLVKQEYFKKMILDCITGKFISKHDI